jgi:cytochrome oxidase assembly protein ShyY1
MAALLERPFLPYALVVTGSIEAGQWPRAKNLPPMDEGPHASYAFQWFAFATIFFGGWLAVLWRASRKG